MLGAVTRTVGEGTGFTMSLNIIVPALAKYVTGEVFANLKNAATHKIIYHRIFPSISYAIAWWGLKIFTKHSYVLVMAIE